MMKLSNIQILILRLVVGGLFLSIGIHKIDEGWLHILSHCSSH